MSATPEKTHNDIMCEDGFELISHKRRRINRPKLFNTAKIQHYDGDEDSLICVDQVCLAVEYAHTMIDEHLSEYMQNLLDTLHSLIGTQHSLKTVRVIGIGSFYSRLSDSSLQIAVLERVLREFNGPECFYQEPRCVNAEKEYLNTKDIRTLQSDSLQQVPNEIAELIRENKSMHLVYMIHFDHYGFENLLNSFEALNSTESLIFIGNTVPTDYKGKLRSKLKYFCEQPLKLPLKTSSTTNQRDKCLAWWRKSFANTSIYSHLNLFAELS